MNTERLAKLGVKEVPKCWKDLTDPRLKGEVQICRPSKCGYRLHSIGNFRSIMGRKEAFDFLKALHPNVSQYTKSGITPSRNSARGEATIGVGFLHDYALEKTQWCAVRISRAL